MHESRSNLRVLPGMRRFLLTSREFESRSLQRGASCEPDFLDRGAENIAERDSDTHYIRTSVYWSAPQMIRLQQT
jgi:hypothetical protein